MHRLTALLIGGLLAAMTIGPPAACGADAPLGGPVEVLGDSADLLSIGLGGFNIDNGRSSPAGRLEWRFGRKLFFVGPALGVLANLDGGVFGYGGLYADVLFFRRLVFTPLLAAGGYHEGGSKDLGGTFQFRSALELAWRRDDGIRVGVQYAHISNANIYDRNPGEEDLFLTFAFPF